MTAARAAALLAMAEMLAEARASTRDPAIRALLAEHAADFAIRASRAAADLEARARALVHGLGPLIQPKRTRRS